MKNKLVIYLFTIFISLLLIANTAKADIFVLNLKYDFNKKFLSFADENSKVILDKQKTLSVYELDTGEKKSGDYMLRVFDAKDYDLFDTEFQPTSESFQIEIPYMATASYLEIYIKKNNQEIMSAYLSQFSTCNNNKICEFEKGETALNCLGDCADSKPVFSEQTKNKLKDNNGIIKDPTSGETLLSDPEFFTNKTTKTATNTPGIFSLVVLIMAVAMLVVAVGFLIYKKVIKKD
jgi:hypothetical protein